MPLVELNAIDDISTRTGCIHKSFNATRRTSQRRYEGTGCEIHNFSRLYAGKVERHN